MTAYAFTGPSKITSREAGYIDRIVRELEDVDTIITGAATGVDTVVCSTALDAFPSAKHIVCVPGDPAWHNEDIISKAKSHGAKIVQCNPGLIPSEAFMNRNDEMVKRCEVLIGMPATPRELRRSGTWATIRRGKKADKHVLVLPLNRELKAGT